MKNQMHPLLIGFLTFLGVMLGLSVLGAVLSIFDLTMVSGLLLAFAYPIGMILGVTSGLKAMKRQQAAMTPEERARRKQAEQLRLSRSAVAAGKLTGSVTEGELRAMREAKAEKKSQRTAQKASGERFKLSDVLGPTEEKTASETHVNAAQHDLSKYGLEDGDEEKPLPIVPILTVIFVIILAVILFFVLKDFLPADMLDYVGG